MIKQGSWVWSRETTEVKCHSHAVILLSIGLTAVDVDLDLLAQAVSSSSPTRKLLFLLLSRLLPRRELLCLTHTYVVLPLLEDTEAT
jgi:hypothetical protein